jgi:hypothetical protein
MDGGPTILRFLARLKTPRIVAALLGGWTVLVATGGYLLKSLADKSFSFQERADEVRDERALAFEAAPLNEFWWPVYLRLQLDSSAWTGIASTESDKRLNLFQPDLVSRLH